MRRPCRLFKTRSDSAGDDKPPKSRKGIKKDQPVKAGRKAPPLKEGFGVVVDIVGGKAASSSREGT